jgi:hypothetical protein
MKLTLERFGGVAGLPARPLSVDTSAIPSADGAELEALATRAMSTALAADENAGAKRDSFSYQLTIEAAGESRVIAFDATQTRSRSNDALRQLVSALRLRAKVASGAAGDPS